MLFETKTIQNTAANCIEKQTYRYFWQLSFTRLALIIFARARYGAGATPGIGNETYKDTIYNTSIYIS